MLLTSGDSGVNAQSGCSDCSGTGQHATSNGITAWGVESGTTVNVTIVNVDDAFDSTQMGSIQTAAGGIATAINQNASGSTVSITTSTTEPNDASAANPVMEVEQETQAEVDDFCSAKSGTNVLGCTNWYWDGQGHTYYSLTVVVSTISSSLLEQLMTHEFSMPFLGLQECSTCTCTIANMNISSSSPTAPTSCDKTTIKNSQCK
jgi:hypothetical protein